MEVVAGGVKDDGFKGGPNILKGQLKKVSRRAAIFKSDFLSSST